MLESAAVKLANPAMDASNEAFAARISALEMGVVRPVTAPVKQEVVEDDAPPFEVDEPIAVAEIAAVEEPTIEPTIEPTPEPTPAPPSQGAWQEVLEQIRTVNPMVYGLICDVESQVGDGCVTLFFEDKTLLDMIAENDSYDALLRKASGGKVQYKLKNEQQAHNGDPLEEILAKQPDFEGQMTIL